MKFTQSVLIASLTSIVMFGCSKSSDNQPAATTSTPSNNISYTVNVLSAANLASARTQKTTTIQNATVYANVNGTVQKVTTDISGRAIFSLSPGIISVTVMAQDFLTLDYIVDLSGTSKTDTSKTSTTSSSTSIGYASTIVALLPTSGDGTATVMGTVSAKLDQTATGFQFVASQQINAYITSANNNLSQYINHTEQGTILKAAIEASTFKNSTTSQGVYTLTLPASAKGIQVTLSPTDFQYNVKLSANTNQEHVFKAPEQTITVKSSGTYFADILYN